MSLYDKKVGEFYEAGLYTKNIIEASERLGSYEAQFKWFIYSINDSSFKNNEARREERIERAIAYYNGQNERRKRKLDLIDISE